MSKALEIEHQSFLDAFCFQNLLPFELGGRQHPVDQLAHRVEQNYAPRITFEPLGRRFSW